MINLNADRKSFCSFMIFFFSALRIKFVCFLGFSSQKWHTYPKVWNLSHMLYTFLLQKLRRLWMNEEREKIFQIDCSTMMSSQSQVEKKRPERPERKKSAHTQHHYFLSLTLYLCKKGKHTKGIFWTWIDLLYNKKRRRNSH